MNCPRCDIKIDDLYKKYDYYQCDNCFLYEENNFKLEFHCGKYYILICDGKSHIYNNNYIHFYELNFILDPKITSEQLEKYIVLL
jgi:hypothetical protein